LGKKFADGKKIAQKGVKKNRKNRAKQVKGRNGGSPKKRKGVDLGGQGQRNPGRIYKKQKRSLREKNVRGGVAKKKKKNINFDPTRRTGNQEELSREKKEVKTIWR